MTHDELRAFFDSIDMDPMEWQLDALVRLINAKSP